jgi:hypothetical protein
MALTLRALSTYNEKMETPATRLFRGLWADLKSLKPSLIVPIILVIALAVRLAFFFGMGFSDDLQYSYEAYRVSAGTFHDTHGLIQMRLGVILPIALLYRLFGPSDLTLVAYSLACSLGLIVLIFLLGRMLFGEKTGLLASLLLAFFPLEIEEATSAMPDVPQAFFIALALYHFMSLYGKTGSGELAFSRSLRGYFITGLIAGFAYFIRDTAVLIFPFLALFLTVDYLLNNKHESMKEALYSRFRIMLALMGGFLVIFLLEGFYHYGDTGDFLLRYHIMSAYYTSDTQFFANGICQDMGFYPREIFHITPQWQFSTHYYYAYGFFYYAITPALFYVILFHSRKARVPLLWALFFFLYLQFGSMSLFTYIPVHRLSRHLTLITVPALLILSFALTALHASAKKRGSGLFIALAGGFISLLVAALAASSLYAVALTHRHESVVHHDVERIYQCVKNYPGVTVYTDSGTNDHLRFLDRYKHWQRFEYYSSLAQERPEKKRIIVLDSSRGPFEDPEHQGPPPAWRVPGKNWTLLEEIEGPQYDIWARFNPKVFMVIDE